MPRILIIEDEPKLLRNLREGLSEEGFDVLTAADGEAGYRMATTEPIDLVLLDLMLPRMPGLELLAAMRENGRSTPVLVLTAKDGIGDRVAGLDGGADDYLVKPFAFDELLARIRALLRRNSETQTRILRIGRLEVNTSQRRVTLSGSELAVSAREYELLEYLIAHAGQVLSMEEIARDVWQETGAVETNIIDVYVNYLRRKIEKLDHPALIHTIGYCLKVD
ncbi:MAG: response regulator transcription factor [Planctomycetota bacterium]|nr:response regulator transcription factor [Planctomycetota bacterium]